MNNIEFRLAKDDDLTKIIALIHDDFLGKTRESLDGESYKIAFDEILATQNNYLFVITENYVVIGTFHITIIPSMPLHGAKRSNVESVHIDSSYRGKGYGSLMIAFILEFSKQQCAKICQLTTNKKRVDAKRFYEKNGFTATHEGMKIDISR